MAAVPVTLTRPSGVAVEIMTSEVIAIATLDPVDLFPPPGPSIVYTTGGPELVAEAPLDVAQAMGIADPVISGGFLFTADFRLVVWITGYLAASAIVEIGPSTTSIAYLANRAIDLIVEETIANVATLVFVPPTGGAGPLPSDATPQPDSVGGGSGGSPDYTRAGHSHPFANFAWLTKIGDFGSIAPSDDFTLIPGLSQVITAQSPRLLAALSIVMDVTNRTPLEAITVGVGLYVDGAEVLTQSALAWIDSSVSPTTRVTVVFTEVLASFFNVAKTYEVRWKQLNGTAGSVALAANAMLTISEIE